MNFYADYVRNKLNAAISSMSSQIEDFVKNPGHDFTRRDYEKISVNRILL